MKTLKSTKLHVACMFLLWIPLLNAQQVVVSLEAEDGELTSPAKVKEVAGYSGNKYVGNNDSGSSIVFNDVEVEEEGTYEFKTYYTSMQNRSIAVKVNNFPEAVSSIVTTTPGWDAPPTGTMSTLIYLSEGKNTIKITPHPSNQGGPNMDKFEILTTDEELPKPDDFPILLEAEFAHLYGSLKMKPTDGSRLPDLSGGRYIGDFNLSSKPYLQYTDLEIPEEGTYELKIYSMGAARPLSVKVNQYEKSIVKTISSPNWDSAPTTMISTLIYLDEGKNTLTFSTAGEDGPNLDKFEIHLTDEVIEKPPFEKPYPESCGGIDEYKISYMGSSVCYGSGATNDRGYAYMYTELLKQRYQEGLGEEWTTSNISIGGNTTQAVLNRWERDLLTDCGRYVLYGLSIGNERNDGTPTSQAFENYRNGMLELIEKAEEVGIIPVMANNYSNGGFNASDYNYVKQLNLLIHEWDVPSINTLGAVDNGAGRWATGYENDGAHPNTAGHEEFFHAMVPSLFDALDAGKPLPQIIDGTSYKLGSSTASGIEFTPEAVVHPFTVSFEIKTNSDGTIATFQNGTADGTIKIDSDGKVIYESPVNGQIKSTLSVTDNEWQRITLTHYYARGITMLYVNDEKAGEINEKLTPEKFTLSHANAPAEIDYRQLFFWRAGMNPDEISYINNGKMLKSSLEIYAPLGGSEPLANLAQSTNTLNLTGPLSLRESVSTGLFVHPNPVKKGGKIKINGSGILKIYSSSGSLLGKYAISDGNPSISTDNLVPGIHIIHLTNNEKTKQSILIII